MFDDIGEPAARPRILITQADLDRACSIVTDDEQAAAWYANLQRHGKALLSTPPKTYDIPDGRRLLSTSRAVLDRVRTLATLWLLTDEHQYVDRAYEELATAAAFPDWNPSHFLDTAEMTAAFAIGLDWLAEAWTDEQRDVITTAIIDHGLSVAAPGYRGDDPTGHTWFIRAEHNWNTVCNGGMTMGALALLGEDVDQNLLETILVGAHQSLERAVAEIAPNGGWAEGPGYFSYNTRYLTYYLSSMQHTLGTDGGYLAYPGMDGLGTFITDVTGPSGRPYDFCDSHTSGLIDSSALLWLARTFDKPAWAAYQLQSVGDDGDAQDLLWYDPTLITGSEEQAKPRAGYYPGAEETITIRECWNDPDAAFLGCKGGDNQVNHGDLDLGSFVFDRFGTRWAIELPPNNYNVPGYWGMGVDGGRWRYYRKRAEGHNTLVIDPDGTPDQHPFATAAVERFERGPDEAFAIIDLSAAYQAASVRRGLALTKGRTQLVITDELVTRKPTSVRWFMHTRAAVDADGATANLTTDDASLVATIVEPADATFTVMDARPLPSSPAPEEEELLSDVRKLAVELPEVTDERLTVHLGAPGESAPTGRPLQAWCTHR